MKKLLLLLLLLIPTITKADTNGLVGYWSFNEGKQGIAHDYSGNRNDATATSSINWTTGRLGNGILFPSGTQLLTAGTAPQLSGTALGRNVTFSAWVYPTSFTDHSYHTVIAKVFTANWWFGLYTTTGRIQTWVGGLATQSTGSIPLNKWSHIASTWDGANVRYYINGVLDSTVANTNAPVGSSAKVTIGADFNAGSSAPYNYWFTGVMDEVKIYNRTLSPKQIQSEYQAGLTILNDISNDKLVAHWSFNEGTSTLVHDISGNNINATTTVSNWTAGRLGKALNLTGALADYVQIQNNKLNVSGNKLTLSTWVYPRALANLSNGNGVISNGNSVRNDGNYEILLIQSSSNNYAFFRTALTSVNTALTGTKVLPLNKWSHITAVYDGANAYLYVNGVLDVSQARTGNLTTDGTLTRIGRRHVNANPDYISEAFDDMRIYSRALSADEVLRLYKSGETIVQEFGNNTGLLAYYPLDEATSTTMAKDYSGNNNNLRLIATPTWVSGRVGSALNFNGISQMASSTRNLGIVGNAEFTMCSWIYMDRTTVPTGYESFMGNDSTGTTDRGLSMTVLSARPAVDFWNNRYRATNALSLKTWHHVCGTKVAGTISPNSKIYVNGVVVSGAVEGTNSTPNILDAPAVVGRLSANSTYWFTGKVDESRFYNRALSASEIYSLYKSGSAFIK